MPRIFADLKPKTWNEIISSLLHLYCMRSGTVGNNFPLLSVLISLSFQTQLALLSALCSPRFLAGTSALMPQLLPQHMTQDTVAAHDS